MDLTQASWWQEDGSVQEAAPHWARLRSDMRSAFPAYYSAGGKDPFARLVEQAVRQLDKLKPAPDGPAFLGTEPGGPRYKDVAKAELASGMEKVEEVVRQSVALFQGMPNWNHPLTMPNVIPPGNLAAIVGAMMADVFSPNIIEGEYAWNVERAEMETAAMLARLIGWNPSKAGGLFTFGGSGCYLYGLKYALTQVLGPQSRCRGVRTDAKLLVSQQGHYCNQNSTDWTGLGIDNIELIPTDESNAMDVGVLEEKIRSFHAQGIPIAAIVCTMGTTDAFGMDPVAKVRELIEKYPNPKGYGKIFLYCDAVIGWSWLTFGTYDFKANPLGFSREVLPLIRENLEKIRQMEDADAIGCDFHKVGWSPYNSSIVMMRDLNHFKELMTRQGSAYLQARTCYNPGLYTLEVSRSGSYCMAAWATLKFFGHEGFQAVLGGILEMEHYLRELLGEEKTLVCVNQDDHGFVTLFRVYSPGVDAKKQYEKELNDPSDESRKALDDSNKLQEKVADLLWSWVRDGRHHHGSYAPYISYTSGFRSTTYSKPSPGVIYALKSFPMNVNIDPRSMDTLVRLVLAARDEVVKGHKAKKPEFDCQPPYKENFEGIDCKPRAEGSPAGVQDLLSGVVHRGRR